MEKQGGEYLFHTFILDRNRNIQKAHHINDSLAQHPQALLQPHHASILTLPVPMQQYPQSPDLTGASQQPPVYQDPAAAQYNAQHQATQAQYEQQQQQHQQPQYQQPYPQQQAQSPAPHEHQQKAFGAAPGMPPQQPSGPVYQNATPIANLGRGPAPADCPACGQRSMTNCAFETGNTTQ